MELLKNTVVDSHLGWAVSASLAPYQGYVDEWLDIRRKVPIHFDRMILKLASASINQVYFDV